MQALKEAKKNDVAYGVMIVKAHDTLRRESDPSAHAETSVICSLTNKINNSFIEGYIIYTTSELLCANACVWTGISEIVFRAKFLS